MTISPSAAGRVRTALGYDADLEWLVDGDVERFEGDAAKARHHRLHPPLDLHAVQPRPDRNFGLEPLHVLQIQIAARPAPGPPGSPPGEGAAPRRVAPARPGASPRAMPRSWRRPRAAGRRAASARSASGEGVRDSGADRRPGPPAPRRPPQRTQCGRAGLAAAAVSGSAAKALRRPWPGLEGLAQLAHALADRRGRRRPSRAGRRRDC